MSRLGKLLRFAGFLALAAAVIDQLSRPSEERTWTGNVLFIPYDFRPPSLDKIMERWWNPDDERILTPHVWGVGWSINLYQLRELLSDENA